MIGRLRGKLVYKKPPELLVDIHGVCYELLASMNCFYHLPNIDEEVLLFTHLIVREDAHTLFGFVDAQERELFRLLIKVNGVGPKSALTILSGISAEEFVWAVTEQDTLRLTKLPGIGKKTAERLVIEMRDRLNDFGQDLPSSSLASMSQPVQPHDRLARQEALSALVALGYKPQEATRVLNQIENIEQLSSEAIIRAALKLLMR